jgi:exoribonuclease-2
MPRGTRVKLDVIGWDELDLTLEARFLEVVSEPNVQEPDTNGQESEDA